MSKIIKLSNDSYLVTRVTRHGRTEALQPALNWYGKVTGVRGSWSVADYVHDHCLVSRQQADQLLVYVKIIEEIKEKLS